MDKHVVIIGGGLSGLHCAQKLAPHFDVTVFEKDPEDKFCLKMCAEGLTPRGQSYISSKYYTVKLSKALLEMSPNIKFRIPTLSSIVTFDRRQYLLDQRELAIQKGATVLNKATVTEIDLEKKVVTTASGDFQYDILIGADGSNSRVRKKLDLDPPFGMRLISARIPYDKLPPGVPKKSLWLKLLPGLHSVISSFPNRGFTWLGIGWFPSEYDIPYVSYHFKSMLSRMGFDVESMSLTGSLVNTNRVSLHPQKDVYLIGDAAGVASSLTGEGIPYSLSSAEFVSRKIRGLPSSRIISPIGNRIAKHLFMGMSLATE